MATELKKAVRRAVSGIDIERRGIIITLYPGNFIGLRARRTRKEFTIPIAVVYRLAAERTIAADKAAKKKAKAAREGKPAPRPRRRLVSRGLLTTGGF
jgi:hypothetical protein